LNSYLKTQVLMSRYVNSSWSLAAPASHGSKRTIQNRVLLVKQSQVEESSKYRDGSKNGDASLQLHFSFF